MAFGVTNTFTTDTTAVASEVNTNFSEIETELNTFPTDGALASNCVTFAKLGCEVDEDDMSSDSATHIPTQQSVKAYVDNRVGLTYRYLPIDASSTQVYTKYLTGTLDSDSSTSVAHGLTAANILHVSVIVYNSGDSTYRVAEYDFAASAADAFAVKYDATNINIHGVGANSQGQAYRIKIDYK